LIEQWQETVGTFLKKLRIKYTIQQKKVAELLGVFPTAVSNWENNRNAIASDKLDRIPGAYRMDEEEKARFLQLIKGPKITLAFPASPELALEAQILCAWTTLPKESRERISRMMRAYESSLADDK